MVLIVITTFIVIIARIRSITIREEDILNILFGQSDVIHFVKTSQDILREIFALDGAILNRVAIHGVLWNGYAWCNVRATTTATLDGLHFTCYGTRITT